MDIDICVVIPFYNGSVYLERALRSVARQTLPAKEVVVVDDGSAADEAEWLRLKQAEYGFVHVRQANAGQAAARNAGVRASTSAYICFLDQDDYFLDRHNEILAGAIPRGDTRFGWAFGDLYEAEADGQLVYTSVMKRRQTTLRKENLLTLLAYDMFVLPSAAIVSRRAFEEIDGFDAQFRGYEDDDFFLRLFRAGFSNIFIDEALTVWCVSAASTSYSMWMSESRLRYFEKLVLLFPDDPFRKRFVLRDCLVPRFESRFVDDVLSALRVKSPTLVRKKEILARYAAKVLDSQTIAAWHKFRLRWSVWCLTRAPSWFARMVKRTLCYKVRARVARV